MRKRTLVTAAAGMAAFALAASQAAAVPTITCPGGDIVHGCSFNDVAGSGSFYDRIDANTSFTDIYNVTLAQAGAVTITLTNTPMGMTFSSLLFDGNPFSVGTTGTTFNVGAGTYQLQLGGSSDRIASYSGTIDYRSVPEPATWGMMMLGLGAIAGALRYRRRRTAISFA